jgi:hypothetical protein
VPGKIDRGLDDARHRLDGLDRNPAPHLTFPVQHVASLPRSTEQE